MEPGDIPMSPAPRSPHPLPPSSAKDYTTKSADHLAKNTYRITIPATQFLSPGLEYHLEATTRDGKMTQWLARAGTINQTVILGR